MTFSNVCSLISIISLCVAIINLAFRVSRLERGFRIIDCILTDMDFRINCLED